MIGIEVLLTVFFCVLSGLAIKTDTTSGMILNKHLLPVASIAVALDGIYYGIFARDITVDFLVNFVLIAFIGVLLFYSHSFAGGDCKLCIVLALLYPGRFYLAINSSIYTLYMAIGLAVFYGYMYLLIGSVRKIITRKKSIELAYVKNYILAFVKSFMTVTIYITGISLLVILVEKAGLLINPWITRGVCLSMAWLIGKKKWLKKPALVIGIFMVDVVLVMITRMLPLSLNPSNYVLAFVLLICQMMIGTDLYEEVRVAELKKGMILSTMSSLLMQQSRVRGLPKVSYEDLRSRLTEVEVESVKRWAKTRNIQYVTIVRKIPFAAFLVMGYISYFVIWSAFR